jgi:hypothetical protein
MISYDIFKKRELTNFCTFIAIAFISRIALALVLPSGWNEYALRMWMAGVNNVA